VLGKDEAFGVVVTTGMPFKKEHRVETVDYGFLVSYHRVGSDGCSIISTLEIRYLAKSVLSYCPIPSGYATERLHNAVKHTSTTYLTCISTSQPCPASSRQHFPNFARFIEYHF
jgi:hypothetical protein